MGSCCCGLCNCCACECCEPRDDWNITDQIRIGERGAGWLYKRGKGSAVWSKRFFVLTSERIIYYTDSDRLNPKGEIILVGSTIKVSATRASAKKSYYFTITHPQCGVRELYAKSNVRRSQWIEKVTEVCNELKQSGAMMGKLYKQGGISKNVWQERWCLIVGNAIYYYENPTDSSPKGFLELSNSKIREFSLKDRSFCFEIIANSAGKKGLKKYNFCVDKDEDRTKWLKALNLAAKYKGLARKTLSDDEEAGSANPIHQEMERGDVSFSSNPSISSNMPERKEGILKKKSPSLMTGWQKRFFVIVPPGEFVYYEKEDDFRNGESPKGSINLSQVVLGSKGIDLIENDQIRISIGNRVFELKAKSKEEAMSWIDAISEWVAYCADL